MSSFVKWVLVILVVLGVIMGFILTYNYYDVFGGDISEDLSKWNTFSSFFNLVAVVVFGSLNLMLLYYIFSYQSKLTKEVLNFQLDRQETFEKENMKRQLMWEEYKPFSDIVSNIHANIFENKSIIDVGVRIIGNSILQNDIEIEDRIIKIRDSISNIDDKTRDIVLCFKKFSDKNTQLFSDVNTWGYTRLVNQLDAPQKLALKSLKYLKTQHGGKVLNISNSDIDGFVEHSTSFLDLVNKIESNYYQIIQNLQKQIIGD